MQENRPVAYASRALTCAETRYAQIEKELLAVVFALEIFHQYIYGTNVEIESDHKPLEIKTRKQLCQAPPRLQRLLLRLQRYDFTLKYRPGKDMVIADTLSRAYISDTSTDRMDNELMSAVHMVLENAPATDKRIQEIEELTQSDTTLQRLKSVIRSGWPDERTDLPEDVQSYWNFKDELSEAEGIIMKGEKIVIPTSLRKDMLSGIHRGHLGIVKCTQRGREAIYWPGMCKDIEELVGKCEVCQRYRESNTKEPLISEPISDKPWDLVAMDQFQWNNNDYVLIVDYYSRYFEVNQLEDTTSRTVITHTKSRHGIPSFLRSDNGPQFSSAELKSFGSE